MNADADREEFRRHVTESDRLAQTADADAANAATSAAEAVANRWRDRGELVAFLTPLLADAETEAVRFNAASILLAAGHSEAAVPALDTLQQAGTTTAAGDARMLLRYWRRQNA